MTATEILARIGEARARLQAVVAAMPNGRLMERPRSGGWPVAGHLTHIAAWERMLVAHLADGTDHDVAGMTAEEYARVPLDELNARIYELHAQEPPEAVRAEFTAAHQAMLRCIERLTPDELARPYWPDDARTVAEKLAGDTYLHYDEHREWIVELVAVR